jgi:hypothetical protein
VVFGVQCDVGNFSVDPRNPDCAKRIVALARSVR